MNLLLKPAKYKAFFVHCIVLVVVLPILHGCIDTGDSTSSSTIAGLTPSEPAPINVSGKVASPGYTESIPNDGSTTISSTAVGTAGASPVRVAPTFKEIKQIIEGEGPEATRGDLIDHLHGMQAEDWVGWVLTTNYFTEGWSVVQVEMNDPASPLGEHGKTDVALEFRPALTGIKLSEGQKIKFSGIIGGQLGTDASLDIRGTSISASP